MTAILCCLACSLAQRIHFYSVPACSQQQIHFKQGSIQGPKLADYLTVLGRGASTIIEGSNEIFYNEANADDVADRVKGDRHVLHCRGGYNYDESTRPIS